MKRKVARNMAEVAAWVGRNPKTFLEGISYWTQRRETEDFAYIFFSYQLGALSIPYIAAINSNGTITLYDRDEQDNFRLQNEGLNDFLELARIFN